MYSFEEYRRRRLNEEGEQNLTGADQANTIQQVPGPQPESDGMLAGALQGAGLGLVAGVLGAVGLKKIRRMLARSGYGKGANAFLRYAKSLVGIQPYQPHKFTPEEQQQIVRRFTQIVGQEQSDLKANKEAPEGHNPLMAERTKDFIGHIFNPAKTPRRAVAALERAVAAFGQNQQPDPVDAQTVVGALSGGSASDEFRTWFKQNATKPSQVDQSKGRGKNKQSFQYTKFELGKLPMSKVDFNLIIKFYHSIYGYPMSDKTSSLDAPKPHQPTPPPTNVERDAKKHQLSRTADALQNNRQSGNPYVPPVQGDQGFDNLRKKKHN